MAFTRVAVAIAALVLISAAGARADSPRTERVSVSSRGEQANSAGSWWYLAPMAALSSTGTLVAFSSDATNLVSRDRNRASDVFLRDRARGRTRRVSLTASGREANGLSFAPAMAADGRSVAFLSEATNLPGVRRRQPGRYVFVRDLAARTTARVDVSSSGQPGLGQAWGPPSISADGRYVAFTTDAPNLAPGDADTSADVFVHDRVTHETTGLSLGPGSNGEYQFSVAGGISGDGRFIAFVSSAPLAAGADTGAGPGLDGSDVFLRDTLLQTTTWIGASGVDVFDAYRAQVSDDGRVVAFEQRSPRFGVVVWDAASGTTTCISCWDGTGPATWDTLSGMSADGRRIAFIREENLSPGVVRSAFIHDRATGVTDRISVGAGNALANGGSGLGGLSRDGRIAAFTSDASNLVRGDTNRRTDVFVRGPL